MPKLSQTRNTLTQTQFSKTLHTSNLSGGQCDLSSFESDSQHAHDDGDDSISPGV